MPIATQYIFFHFWLVLMGSSACSSLRMSRNSAWQVNHQGYPVGSVLKPSYRAHQQEGVNDKFIPGVINHSHVGNLQLESEGDGSLNCMWLFKAACISDFCLIMVQSKLNSNIYYSWNLWGFLLVHTRDNQYGCTETYLKCFKKDLTKFMTVWKHVANPLPVQVMNLI